MSKNRGGRCHKKRKWQMSGWHMYQHLLYKRIQLLIIIIIINGGILSLTDSHHHHHGQNPTMVGICHGGNVLGNHDEFDEFDEYDECDETFSSSDRFGRKRITLLAVS